jgi:hypothetical protein
MNAVRHAENAARYRALAADAEAARDAATLDHVRAKHAEAHATWTALADAEETRGTGNSPLSAAAHDEPTPQEEA